MSPTCSTHVFVSGDSTLNKFKRHLVTQGEIMKTRVTYLTVLSIVVAFLAANAEAQNFPSIQQELQQARHRLNQNAPRTVHNNQVVTYPGSPINTTPGNPYYPGNNQRGHIQPVPPPTQFCPVTGRPIQPVLPQPQYPVYVTPDRYDGINPYTGGIDTRNEQVDNTYYDPNRENSKYNGTRRWVRRPIYGAHGQVTGYQEGYVWINSVTGVEHGELKNVTENNQGGKHEQIKLQSVPNSTQSKKGKHTQIQLRSVGR